MTNNNSLTSMNDMKNPVVAPARKYWLAAGLWELLVISLREQKNVAKLDALKNICPRRGDSG